MVNGSPTPPPKPVVKHAYNVVNKIPNIQFAMYRAGPVDCLQQGFHAMVNGLASLKDQEKFPEFVAAARKHGVKLILTLAVEEPPPPSNGG